MDVHFYWWGMEMKKDIFGLMDELIVVDLYRN